MSLSKAFHLFPGSLLSVGQQQPWALTEALLTLSLPALTWPLVALNLNTGSPISPAVHQVEPIKASISLSTSVYPHILSQCLCTVLASYGPWTSLQAQSLSCFALALCYPDLFLNFSFIVMLLCMLCITLCLGVLLMLLCSIPCR